MARNQVPFVPYQQVGLNQAPETRQSIDGATAEAFGAGVGQSMQKFGRVLEDVADPWAREEMRLQQYKDTSNAIDFETKIGQEFEAAKGNLTGAGEGFAKNFLQGIDKQAEDLRKSTGGQVPRGFDISLQKIKATYFDRALQVEQGKRDEFYQTDINKKLQPIFAGAAANPDPKAREAFFQQGKKLIDSSGLDPIVKEKMNQKLGEDLDMAYALGLKDRNPERVVVSLGGQGQLAERIAMKESSNKPIGKHPGSSAWGRYGFTEDRWQDVANSPEGRAAGLDSSVEGRKSDAQQQAAFPIHMRMLAEDLKRNGLEVNDKNLYLLHFMGPGDGPKMMKAMRDDPNASAADMFPKPAAANPKVFYYEDGSPRTVEAVYQLQTRGLTGKEPELGGDPVLTRLSFNNQQRVLGQAENQIRAELSAQAAQQKAAHAEYINDFQMRLLTGQYGAGDIAAAVNQGRVTDYDDVVKLESVLKRFQEKTTDSQLAAARIGAGQSMNQYSATDRKQVNALGETIKEQTAGDPDKEMLAHMSVYQSSGIASQAMVAQMRKGVNSSNPTEVGRTARMAWEMVRTNPIAFDAIDNAKDLQDAADNYQVQLGLGKSHEEAAKTLAERNDPEKQKNIFQKKEVEDLQKKMLEKPAELSSQIVKDLGLGNWISSNPKPEVANTMNVMLGEYAQLVVDNFKQWPDEADARAKAIIQMKRKWGEFDGQVMPFPPSKTYKGIGEKDPFAWVKESVTADVTRVFNRLHPGATLGEVKLQTMPETIQDIALGKPARYQVWYKYKNADGVTLNGMIPAKQGWSDDGTAYKAAYEKFSAANSAQAKGEVTAETVGSMQRRPNETPTQSAARVNRERARAETQAKEDLAFAQERLKQKPGLALPSPEEPKPAVPEGAMPYRGRMVVPGGGNVRN